MNGYTYSLESMMLPFSAPLPVAAFSNAAAVPTSGTSPTPSKSMPPKAAKAGKSGKVKRWTWKKPSDKPKRPLSAYNLFFASERQRIISSSSEESDDVSDPTIPAIVTSKESKPKKRPHRKTHGKISFANLARSIAEKWKALDESARAPFVDQAFIEKERYVKEMKKWNLAQEIRRGKEKQKKLEMIIEHNKKKEEDERKIATVPEPLKSASINMPALPLVSSTVLGDLFKDIDDALGPGDDEFVSMPSTLCESACYKPLTQPISKLSSACVSTNACDSMMCTSNQDSKCESAFNKPLIQPLSKPSSAFAPTNFCDSVMSPSSRNSNGCRCVSSQNSNIPDDSLFGVYTSTEDNINKILHGNSAAAYCNETPMGESSTECDILKDVMSTIQTMEQNFLDTGDGDLVATIMRGAAA